MPELLGSLKYFNRCVAVIAGIEITTGWSRWKVMLDDMFRIFFRLVLVNVILCISYIGCVDV